jgi:hypothetical protein
MLLFTILNNTVIPGRGHYLAVNNGGGLGCNGSYGMFAIRRRFTNMTGSPVTRLRFRIVDVTNEPPCVEQHSGHPCDHIAADNGHLPE